jgi:glycosyltransferase involved in cell wall biosynthesis
MRYPEQYRLQHYYFLSVVPRLLSRAVAVIADSQSTKQDIHDHYKVPLSKIHVVYSGLEEDVRPVSEPYRSQVLHRYALTEYLVLVGASFPHKNVERAIQAWAAVKETLPGMKFVIAGGRTPYLEKLRQNVTRSKIDGVEFLGYVPRNDLIALYSAAQALVYPSLYEGFGLPPLEAMACGCPAIVSNTSSLPEVCGDAAYYVDPYNPDVMAEAIRKVATDEDTRTVLKRKGFERAAQFSWVTTAQSVYKVLESVQMAH